MSYTNGNSSKASKEVKENNEIKMGFRVCGAIHREEPVKQNEKEDAKTQYKVSINDSEIVDYITSFENFVEKTIGNCEIKKDATNNIVEVKTKSTKYVKAENGKYKSTPRTRRVEER